MRTVRFDPEQLTDAEEKDWWSEWQKAATKARRHILESWKEWLADDSDPRPPFKPSFKQEVWKELKRWLLEHVFRGKCAYCESPLVFDRYLGDAEHYRPKGSITWRDSATNSRVKARCRLPDGSEIDHPGYFWLAYDWRNLVPACSACNSGAGKVDQFPVQHTHLLQLDDATLADEPVAVSSECEVIEVPGSSRKYFVGPSALDAREAPLLLNPLNPIGDRDPKRHLRYGVGGCVVAVDDSPIGKNSIRVYQLERESLREYRQRAQEQVRLRYYSLMMQPPEPGLDTRVDALLDKYRTGQEDFSSAAMDQLRDDQRRQIPI